MPTRVLKTYRIVVIALIIGLMSALASMTPVGTHAAKSAQETVVEGTAPSITVTKTVDTGDDPAGAGFTVYAAVDDGGGGFTCDTNVEVLPEQLVTSDGTTGTTTFVSIALLEGVTYCVSETTLPVVFASTVFPGADQFVTITNAVGSATFENLTFPAPGLHVSKTNSDGSDPAGAGFTVYVAVDDGGGGFTCDTTAIVAAEQIVASSGTAGTTTFDGDLGEGFTYCVRETTVPLIPGFTVTAAPDQFIQIGKGSGRGDFVNTVVAGDVPTPTAVPTETLIPTETPIPTTVPTETPIPTETPTAIPTATPSPQATVGGVSSQTPVTTSTPVPVTTLPITGVATPAGDTTAVTWVLIAFLTGLGALAMRLHLSRRLSQQPARR